jgi:hypothetical protein
MNFPGKLPQPVQNTYPKTITKQPGMYIICNETTLCMTWQNHQQNTKGINRISIKTISAFSYMSNIKNSHRNQVAWWMLTSLGRVTLCFWLVTRVLLTHVMLLMYENADIVFIEIRLIPSRWLDQAKSTFTRQLGCDVNFYLFS